MRLNLTPFILGIALVAGAALGYLDSRPHWDDTGITVAGLLIVTGTLGFIRPRLALVIALAVGGWIPLIEITQSRNTGSLLALGIALAGALCGAGLRALIAPGGPAAAR